MNVRSFGSRLFLALALACLPVQAFAQAGAGAVPPGDWPSYNRTLAGDRFSPLTQITPENASGLREVCVFDTGENVSFQTGPIVVGGTMYFTSDTVTYAIDAATCALRWRAGTSFAPTYLNVNRGLAHADGQLFRGASDGRVLAIDAATGRALWDVPLGDPKPGESAPMSPLAWNGMVFIGNAGGDNKGVTGRVLALDQENGRILWRFDVVPDSGAARGTWGNAPEVPPTGGAFWTSFGLDPEQGVLYVPAGNPAPDFVPALRPGDNLFTNSVIALDASDGELLGYYQVVRHDVHDWDVSAAPVVLTTRDGQRIVASANKDGLLSVMDRAAIGSRPVILDEPGTLATSQVLELLYQVPTTTRENVDAQLTHRRPVRFCPGTQGGNEWNGPAYHPELNLVFVGTNDWCTTIHPVNPDSLNVKPGGAWGGDVAGGFGTFDSTSMWKGWITAVDADTGVVRWKVQTATPMLAAVTPTAGGVLFTGELNGDAVARDVETGEELWRQATGNAIGGGVVTYEVGGRQYVAVAAGMKSPIWPVPSESSRIVVFGLP